MVAAHKIEIIRFIQTCFMFVFFNAIVEDSLLRKSVLIFYPYVSPRLQPVLTIVEVRVVRPG